jgi:hypothetical protein
VIDEVTGVFDGVIVHTLPLPGRHLYAEHEQIGELRERGVLLSVKRGQRHELGPRSERPRGSDQSLESPL